MSKTKFNISESILSSPISYSVFLLTADMFPSFTLLNVLALKVKPSGFSFNSFFNFLLSLDAKARSSSVAVFSVLAFNSTVPFSTLFL